MRADWVSPWWQAVCLPDTWDVCGLIVPPLSVWHTFALENLGNAYLCGGPADKDAAASLLLFARHDYQGGRRLMLDGKFRTREIKRMHRVLRKLPDQQVHDACAEYVEVCMRAASRWDKGDGKPCAVPYQWHIVARLSGQLGAESAWNMPYAVARCMYDAMAEMNGDDSILSSTAQEMEDNWDEYKDATDTKQVAIGVN